MKKIAILTVLFDYPEYFTPTFEKKLLNDIDVDDYYVIRYNSLDYNIVNESYYFKFTFFRIKEIISFIKEKILNNYEYFVLLDATDVGYVGGINKIGDIMDKYNCNILFGSEKNLWPNTDYSYLYDTKKIQTPYKFLNAGVFYAKPNYFISHIKDILNRELFGLCDQGNWQIEYLLSSDIELDFNNNLVLNTYLAKDDINIVDNNITFNTNTPIFVHDNGGFNDETIKLMEYFK